jgi:hypothetical protein
MPLLRQEPISKSEALNCEDMPTRLGWKIAAPQALSSISNGLLI